jgi:hypothetical protein
MIKFLKDPYLYLLIIVVIAFVVRLYKIDNPIADWHSWRQADTAAVARNFYQDGFNPLYPKGDDMSPISDNGQINLLRYRFVEFPIYPSLVYFGYLLHGGVDESIARLVSVIFSLGSVILIYLLSCRYFGKLVGLISAFFYATIPYAIYYSRVTLPEPSLIFFSLGMFYFTDRWIREQSLKLAVLSLIFGCLALLTKPTAIFYLLPLYYTLYQKTGKILPISLKYFIWGIVLAAPLVLWRLWINQHPEGIPAASWLLNGNNIRFKPIFWRWILQDRFDREILGTTGIIFFWLGFLYKPFLKQGYLLHFLMFSLFLYLIVFATGNVQHDYYQSLIIPGIAIFTARGLTLFIKGSTNFLPKLVTIPLALLFLGMMYYLTWGEVKGLYQINNYPIVEAGKEADKILPKDAVVLAPYQGDTAFLYQTNRHGFPIELIPVDQMISRFKVTSYVTTTKDAKTNWLMQKYTVLEDKADFVIIDLTKPNPNFKGPNTEPA